jgi:hypothetical protein
MTNKDNVFDKEKLAELVIFFASESGNDRLFGSTKLNKLLFLADFLAFGHLGKPITGARYIHQKRGPTPSPDEFLPVRDSLLRDGRLELVPEETFYGTKKRPKTDRKPDLSKFSKKEIEIAYEALETLKHMGNTDSENWSHKFIGWLSTTEGETIPYSSAYLWQGVPLSEEDYEWARETARLLGLGELIYDRAS